ncbi:MAG: hypothetical protein WBA13_06740 [Microcoleaceae cyanobacterium]
MKTRLGAWRNGRRYGLRKLGLEVRNPSSDGSQIQGNLNLIADKAILSQAKQQEIVRS